MAKIIKQGNIAKNITYSLIAQVVSLMVSFLLNLIVPKFISEYNYAYWQTYVLYIGYVGILHFGIVDGLVLRFSQYDYEEIDHKLVRSQFYVLVLIDTILGAGLFLFFRNMFDGFARHIIIFVAIGIVTKNISTYSYYLLQITNRIKKYAGIVIINRLAYGLLVIGLLVLKYDDYVYYCLADLFCDVITAVYAFSCSKELYVGKSLQIKSAVRETLLSASAGFFVLVANWSSNLIIGSGKMIVQWHWDELLFGKMSFAFSVSNMFLTFVTAISVVLFPSIKRMDTNSLPSIYKRIRDAISPILYFVLFVYFPGYWVLDLWLPKYHDSLKYLGILLPIIVYTTIVNLLTNNYLKAYRKEKFLLYINLSSVFVGIILYLISSLVFDSILLLLLSVVIVIILRSIISEIVVMRIIGISFCRDIIIEFLMACIFLMCTNCINLIWGGVAYLTALLFFLFLHRESIMSTINTLHNMPQRTK